jgi:single-stranded DNA-binding protein
MPQINNWTATGRLAFDSEVKYTKSGKAYLQASVFVDDGYGDKKISESWSIKIWGDYAEKVAPNMRKGRPVFIERGKLTMERWEGRDGDNKEKTCVVVFGIHFLEWDDDMDSAPKTPPRAAQDAHSEAKSNGYQPQTDPEDDIPF